MSRSELIRALLLHFPALKPKEIERLLVGRGVSVDANLIGVARLRHRRDRQAERALCGLVAKIHHKRPDLLPALQASFDDLTHEISKIAAAYPGLPEEELADVVAAELPKLPPQETVSARVSRIFLRILEQQPHYRQSLELASGMRPGSVQGVVVHGEGLTDDLTDEQIERAVLKYLDDNFPAGPTAEAIARGYMHRLDEKVKREHEAGEAAKQTAQARAERILAAVVKRLDSQVSNHDAAFSIVQRFVAEYDEWADQEIAERFVAGLKLLTQPESKPKLVPDIKGLSIRARI